MAWTNLDKAVRLLTWQWHGFIRQKKEKRYHPTQKPVGVMQWCIDHLPKDCQTILDPFMGSGSTGIAYKDRDKKFIGIEINEKYFDIACKRIRQHIVQTNMF